MGDYDCEVCRVHYVERRATFLNGSTDASATVGVAMHKNTNEIAQIAMTRVRLNSTRVIFDDYGYGTTELIHEINKIIPGRPPADDQFVCVEFINQWRLPPYVWRDDMDPDQKIVMTAGRWLGTRGTAKRASWGEGFDVRLKLSEAQHTTLNAQTRGSFGWTFRDDNKANIESVLPMALRFPPGTLVWAAERKDYQPVMGHIIKLGNGPNGPLYAVQQLNSEDRFNMDEIHREVTEEERQEYYQVLLDD
jgi:hypothetical protein